MSEAALRRALSTSELPPEGARAGPSVLALADVESTAQALIQQVLIPAGIQAQVEAEASGGHGVIVLDVTQLRGDPLSRLRRRRESGDQAPAIVLAAHVPANWLRDLLHLGVRDVLFKPYRPADLCESIYNLTEARAAEGAARLLAQRLEAERERSRRYAEEVAQLGEIGRAVATLGDLDLILTRVVEAAAFLSRAEEASIYLVQPGGQQLLLRATKQAGDRHASLRHLRVDDTTVGEVLRTQRPLLLHADNQDNPLKVQTGFFVQSLIHVPLRVRERAVGVLGVYNPFEARPFDEHHLTVLVALADWGSVALEHAMQAQSAPAPQEITVAPERLVEGMEHAVNTLHRLASGDYGALTRPQLVEVRAILDELRELQSLPIATIDSRDLTSFVDLPGLAQQVVEALQGEARRKGIALVTEPTGPMPMFPGEPGRIAQVVEGLTAAAIRRTPRGRVAVRTHRFSVRGGRPDESVLLPSDVEVPDGSWAAVTVLDTSPGLSPDTQRALTSPSADPEAGKTGPGLSMGEIRMIAESLGAVLWYEQSPVGVKILFAVPGA